MTSPSITSPAHTPGPWFVAESLKRGFVVRSPRGGFLAWLGTGSLQRDAANAKLMAAAPVGLTFAESFLSMVLAAEESDDRVIRLDELDMQIALAKQFTAAAG